MGSDTSLHSDIDIRVFPCVLMAQAPEVKDKLGSAAASSVQDHIHESKNRSTIRCKHCDEKVLLAGAGEYIQKEIFLHHPANGNKDVIGETLTDHWLVRDRFHFENVGVTRSVDNSNQFRYLVCANCDRGPIGITYANEPQLFYVAHERIQYKD